MIQKATHSKNACSCKKTIPKKRPVYAYGYVYVDVDMHVDVDVEADAYVYV